MWPNAVEHRPDVRVEQTPLPIPSDKKAIDKKEKSTYSVLNSEEVALTETEKHILTLLDRTPKPLDEVISQLDMSAGTVKLTLTKLSVKGIVAMHPGGRVSLK